MASRTSMALRAFGKDCSHLMRSAAQRKAPHNFRCLSSDVSSGNGRRYVRISGAAAYASGEDIRHFMRYNGVEVPDNAVSTSLSNINNAPLPVLSQVKADDFHNNSVWLYDAGSAEKAAEISSNLAGKVVGMRLAWAAPIDEQLLSNVLTQTTSPRKGRASLRQRLPNIAPKLEERGRTIICTRLAGGVQPNMIWSFFNEFDVIDVRMLRKSGVCTVVFRTREEALRAIRERSNVPIVNYPAAYFKMFE